MPTMDQAPRAITWDAPEHHHTEKGGDWFFAFTIIFIAIVLAAILLGNALFALLMAVAGLTLAVAAAKRPAIITYAVTVRGVQVGEQFYPYGDLKSFCIDEEDPKGPQLLVLSKRKLMPLIILPIPDECIDDIENIIGSKLPEDNLEEPLFNKFLEILGF